MQSDIEISFMVLDLENHFPRENAEKNRYFFDVFLNKQLHCMVKKGVLCVSKNLEGGRRQLQPSQDTQCLKNMRKEQFGGCQCHTVILFWIT